MSLSRRDSLGKGNPPLLGLRILGDITGCSSKPDEKHVGRGAVSSGEFCIMGRRTKRRDWEYFFLFYPLEYKLLVSYTIAFLQKLLNPY